MWCECHMRRAGLCWSLVGSFGESTESDNVWTDEGDLLVSRVSRVLRSKIKNLGREVMRRTI